MKDALGDKILLDGIPAIMFLPSCPLKELEDTIPDDTFLVGSSIA